METYKTTSATPNGKSEYVSVDVVERRFRSLIPDTFAPGSRIPRLADLRRILNGGSAPTLRKVIKRLIEEGLLVKDGAGCRVTDVPRPKESPILIGLAVPTSDRFHLIPPFVRGIRKALGNNGYELVVDICNPDDKGDDNVLNRLSRHVSALLMTPVYGGDPEEMRKLEKCVVLLDRKQGDEAGLPLVSSRNRDIGRAAVHHLIRAGCFPIFILTEGIYQSNLFDREQGALQALREVGVATQHLDEAVRRTNSARMFKAGYRLAAALISDDEIEIFRSIQALIKKTADAWPRHRPGVFCTTDRLAAGAMLAFKDAGFRIPRHLGILGVDNEMWTALTEPPLDTIAQDFEEIGAIAARAAKRMLMPGYQGDTRAEDLYAQAYVIKRGSCDLKSSYVAYEEIRDSLTAGEIPPSTTVDAFLTDVDDQLKDIGSRSYLRSHGIDLNLLLPATPNANGEGQRPPDSGIKWGETGPRGHEPD